MGRCREAMLAVAAVLALAAPARAAEATIAVATNFAPLAEALGAAFGARTGHDLRFVAGSTGKLHTQILRGAPYHAFLAADAERPALLEEAGRGSGRFPYAVGRLVLWSVSEEASEHALKSADRLAIANPALAPYGVAAMEVLSDYGREGDDAPALVMGENAGQAAAMVATGNVAFGLVPLSVTVARGGSAWPVPEEAHAPIRQDAVLLAPANAAARGFLAFLRSEAAGAIMEAGGYALPSP